MIDQELKWLAFSLYPLSFFLYSPFNTVLDALQYTGNVVFIVVSGESHSHPLTNNVVALCFHQLSVTSYEDFEFPMLRRRHFRYIGAHSDYLTLINFIVVISIDLHLTRGMADSHGYPLNLHLINNVEDIVVLTFWECLILIISSNFQYSEVEKRVLTMSTP